jgi:glucose-1-phosphatase
MNPVKKVVLFDFGNVLGTFDKERACRELSAYTRISSSEICKRIVDSPTEKAFESGFIDEHVFAREVISIIEAKNLEESGCIKIWGDIFSSNDDLIPLLKTLRDRGIRMAILSNTNMTHYRYFRELQTVRLLQSWGAPCILSHEEKSMKPDVRIFEKAISRLRTDARDIVFIDDKKENVEAARGIGMIGVQYNCKEQGAGGLRTVLAKELGW